MSGSAQQEFLRSGGPLRAVLEHKYETGELQRETPFAEYPKMVRVSRGIQTIHRQTEVLRGKDVVLHEWDEEPREIFDEIIVQSEAEEERVLTGGQTEAQIETQRQEMIAAARARNIQVDPTWSVVRLQREMGAAPTNETVEALRIKVADLQEKAALRQQIADLQAQLAGKAPAATLPHPEQVVEVDGGMLGQNAQNTGLNGPSGLNALGQQNRNSLNFVPVDEAQALRDELDAIGAEYDRRWGAARLRQELRQREAIAGAIRAATD